MRNILILLLLLVAPRAWAQPVGGVVDAIIGSATIAGVSARIGATVPEGAQISTAANSRLRLKLSDGTSFTLGASSAFRLEHLAGAGDTRPTLLRHLFGFLRAVVAPQTTPGGLEIDTESDAAAVRGTEWIERADQESTELFVAAGRVAIRGLGGEVLLGPGQGVTFRKRAPHTLVIRWAPGKVAAFKAATGLP